MYDYLVVGLGLAGISFCEILENEGKTFAVVSDGSQRASQVAGGLYNPVILKRFTMAWKAKEQMGRVVPFYSHLERKLNTKLDYKVPVLRRFASVEEQNAWFEASDKLGLEDFLSTQLLENKNPSIHAPYGFGEVKHTGRLDTGTLVESYTNYLEEQQVLHRGHFDFDSLKLFDDYVEYKDISAKQVVFACGFGLKKNPFFNYLPLNGTKGELLTIKAPEYKEQHVIKSSVFTIPLGDDLYRVGATYKWKDKTNTPTAESKEELVQKLKTFLQCEFEIVQHVAGIRPTVVDRRPLVGQHPKHKKLYVLNGFGSRGVLIAPYASQQLYDAIESSQTLDPEMDVARFTKKYYSN